mgnify:CR=1 FL=1
MLCDFSCVQIFLLFKIHQRKLAQTAIYMHGKMRNFMSSFVLKDHDEKEKKSSSFIYQQFFSIDKEGLLYALNKLKVITAMTHVCHSLYY